jgi:hypothetical protein
MTPLGIARDTFRDHLGLAVNRRGYYHDVEKYKTSGAAAVIAREREGKRERDAVHGNGPNGADLGRHAAGVSSSRQIAFWCTSHVYVPTAKITGGGRI